MRYEVAIRGGQFFGDSGASAGVIDVRTKDRFASATRQIDGDAEHDIDASDPNVPPCFKFLHTRIDAPIGWDPDMTPISWLCLNSNTTFQATQLDGYKGLQVTKRPLLMVVSA